MILEPEVAKPFLEEGDETVRRQRNWRAPGEDHLTACMGDKI